MLVEIGRHISTQHISASIPSFFVVLLSHSHYWSNEVQISLNQDQTTRKLAPMMVYQLRGKKKKTFFFSFLQKKSGEKSFSFLLTNPQPLQSSSLPSSSSSPTRGRRINKLVLVQRDRSLALLFMGEERKPVFEKVSFFLFFVSLSLSLFASLSRPRKN